MRIKNLVSLAFILAIMVACATVQPIDTGAAQQKINTARHQNQHTVWEIDWPNNPAGGLITAETWQAAGRYRYEILESTAPALIGETLVFDGQTAWQYNRLDPPEAFAPAPETLSPVTDAFLIIARLLAREAVSATQQPVYVNSIPVTQITLTFKNGDSLNLWQDEKTGLPVQVEFAAGDQQGKLKARSFEPLLNPPPELFGVGAWVS